MKIMFSIEYWFQDIMLRTGFLNDIGNLNKQDYRMSSLFQDQSILLIELVGTGLHF